MSCRFVGAAKRAHTASPSSTVAELAHAITVFASTASHMGGGGKRRPAARFFVSFSLCPRRRTRVRSRWLARSHVYLSLSLSHTHTHLLSLAFSLFPSLHLSLSLSPLSCLLTLTPAVCDLSSIFTNMSMSLSPHASAPSEVTPDASFTLIRRLPRMGKNTRSCVKTGTTSRHTRRTRTGRGEILPRREERLKGGRVAPSPYLTLLAVEGQGRVPGRAWKPNGLGTITLLE